MFLGADAVANAMSNKYGIDKRQILDAESGQSLGVRLALGETEVVNETRDFLIENGVSLDSFSQVKLLYCIIRGTFPQCIICNRVNLCDVGIYEYIVCHCLKETFLYHYCQPKTLLNIFIMMIQGREKWLNFTCF